MSYSPAAQNVLSPTSPSSLPPETLNHLLSLPTLIQPLSPSLAALHLARVRLLLSIPASPFTKGPGEMWCYSCGGLRDGLEGASRRKRPVEEISAAKRKQPECSQCGASYQQPKPDRRALIGFSPARTRSKRAAAKATRLVPEVVITINSTAGLTRSTREPTAEPESSPIKIRPTLLSTPSLTYIPTSAPNPPTYPEPVARSSPVSYGKGVKRRKKSGLAKLLAENWERSERESGKGGSWGLA